MYAPAGDGGLPRLCSTHLILPAVTLSLVPLAIVSRLTRSSMLDVIAQDYVRTARAKGASERRVIGWHAFRNTLVPLVTVLGLEVGYLLAGAVYVETVFSWPGIGFMMVNAILTRDFPLVQGGVLLIATTYVADQPRDRSALHVRGSARAAHVACGITRLSPPGEPNRRTEPARELGRPVGVWLGRQSVADRRSPWSAIVLARGALAPAAARRPQPDAAEPASCAAAHAGLSARVRSPRP